MKSFATKWMQLKITMLSDISQSQKDKCHTLPLIWGNKVQKIYRVNRNVIYNEPDCHIET